jgi:hypothetical protein
MLMDGRFPEAEAEWQAFTQNGQYAPPLHSISSNRRFFDNPHHVYLNYLTARHEVHNWYITHRQQGLLTLCKCLSEGTAFEQCYRSQ